MSSRQTEDQLQLLLRMEMVRDVFDVDNVGGTCGVDNGVDGGEYDQLCSIVSRVMPLATVATVVQTLPCS